MRIAVFSEDVKYVLVLATPAEIVLLAVWFEGNTIQGALHLEPSTYPELSYLYQVMIVLIKSSLMYSSSHITACG